jgi:primosomal protein N' (replication factor Y)
MVGFGTEKIEEELGIFFPDAVIARLDLDSTRSKYSYQQIIGDFETNKINVLVGTQMVTKGLDFNNVSIVGILNADSMLNFPDFRSYERSFQLMAQVSGRAGRNQKRGKVIIQCQNPMHPIIQHVLMNDYEKMYSQELAERNKFHFPPYHRLIKLTLKHKDYSLIDSASHHLAQDLKKVLGARVLGPESPIVSRVRNLFLKDILIKIEREASISNAKKIIMDIIINFKDLTDYKGVTIHIDVDPY